jgi:hypothetical protein
MENGERFAAVGGDIVGPESRDRPAQSRSARGRSHGTSLEEDPTFSVELELAWQISIVSLVSTAEVGGSIADDGDVVILLKTVVIGSAGDDKGEL